MKVVSVEVLSEEAATNLRRQARRQRREERERAMGMTRRDVINLFDIGLSAFRAHVALFKNTPAVESPLPPVAEEDVGKYEKPETIALLHFARTNGWRPMLVEFDCKPSKAFEDRLRQAAKIRNFKLHFFRLTGGWVALEVHPKEIPGGLDENFLKSLGVKW